MQVFGWVLAALAGWTAIGIAGTALAWTTGDRRRAWRSVGWLGGVWVFYAALLLGVSEWQRQKMIPRGQEECFDGMCFSVVEVVEMGEFKGGAGEGVARHTQIPSGNDSQKSKGEKRVPFGNDNKKGKGNSNGMRGEGTGRLLRVGVRVRNAAGELHGVEGLRGYLVDAGGGKWEQTRGVGGVLFTVRLPGGGVTVSEPVFRVADGAKVLGLVLTREHTAWRWLVIGDTDAIGHRDRRTMLLLE